MRELASRREFLRTAGVVGAAAFMPGSLPGGWLLAQAPQASSADTLRAQMGTVPIQKSTLAPGVTLFSGPGGNVVVLQSPTGKIVVDGFLRPAWPKLKAELDALDDQVADRHALASRSRRQQRELPRGGSERHRAREHAEAADGSA